MKGFVPPKFHWTRGGEPVTTVCGRRVYWRQPEDYPAPAIAMSLNGVTCKTCLKRINRLRRECNEIIRINF